MNLKSVVVVSTTETFTVRGLVMKLKGINLEAFYSAPRVNELKPKCEASDLVILYTDDAIGRYADLLVYLKDYCAENDTQIVVIGANNEYEVVKRTIPEACIHQFFERPLNMEKFLEDMQLYFTEESHEERKKNILIVDDDTSYMTMIRDWLKDKYRISMVNSGMQAITWLANNRPDLILLDYEMPVTTGPQVLEMIRSDMDKADIPVMFLTGNGEKESIMKVLALKPVGYQLKTVDRKTLRDNIANFFTSQKTK